jgi:hypothetical protein
MFVRGSGRDHEEPPRLPVALEVMLAAIPEPGIGALYEILGRWAGSNVLRRPARTGIVNPRPRMG